MVTLSSITTKDSSSTKVAENKASSLDNSNHAYIIFELGRCCRLKVSTASQPCRREGDLLACHERVAKQLLNEGDLLQRREVFRVHAISFWGSLTSIIPPLEHFTKVATAVYDSSMKKISIHAGIRNNPPKLTCFTAKLAVLGYTTQGYAPFPLVN